MFFHSKLEEGDRAYWRAWRHITTRLSVNIDAAMFDSPSYGISDCGMDATFSMTCAAKSIPEGVEKFVGSCLKKRVEYDGWGD